VLILGSRLKELRELKGLRQEDVAKFFSYGKSTISQWESGRNEPEYEILVKLAEYFEVTTDYLLGKTNCLNSSLNSNKIPLLGTIHTGLPILADENINGYFSIPDSMQADFVFRVTGDSMIGAGILDGDYAICHLSDSPQTGQIIVALKDVGSKGEAALKYYFNDGTPKLKAANPAYADLDYIKGYRCAGIMIGLIREDSPAYQTYRVCQNFFAFTDYDEWTKVIEKSSAAGIKPAHLSAHVDMLIEMGKKR
jgi:repressor LexA